MGYMGTIDYSMMSDTDYAVLDGLFAIIMGLYVIALIVGFIAYVIQSYAIMTMARNADIPNPWLAWIPIANIWVMGELITERFGNRGGLTYLLVNLGCIIVSFIPFIGLITAVILAVFNIIVMFWLFAKFSEKPILHTILSIIVPLYFSIALFVMRDNEPVED